MTAAGQREGDGAQAIVTPEATIATNNERARCAQLVINFFLDAGADEAQAIAQPLVAAILRPTPDLSGLPSSEDAYAAMSWDTSLRGKPEEQGNG